MKNKSLTKRVAALISAVLICISQLGVLTSAESSAVVKVGFFAMDGYHIENSGGKSGYGYEYMQALERRMNCTFEYTGYKNSWGEMLAMLDNGEIDILTSSQKTDGLENDYLFSDYPIGVCSYTINVKSGSLKYTAGNSLDGIKLGVLSGDSIAAAIPSYALKNGFTYTAVFFENEALMKKALDEGIEIDAIVSSSLRRSENETAIATVNSAPFYIMTGKNNTVLMAEINRALSELQLSEPQLASELEIKYYSSGTAASELSSVENEYISSLQAAGTVINAYVQPYSDVLTGSQNGIIQQLVNEIQAFSGLTIRLADEKNDDVSLYINALSDSTEADAALTSPYLTISCAGLTRRGTTEVKTAAINVSDAVAMSLITPEVKSVYYDTVEDCINAVKNGEADITYIDSLTGESAVFSDERNALALSIVPNKYYEYTVAVKNNENPLLYSILDKAANAVINNGSAAQIASAARESFTENHSLVSFVYDMPFLALGIVILVFAIVIALMILFFKAIVTFRESNDKMQIVELLTLISRDCQISEYDLLKNKKLSYSLDSDGNLITDKISFDGEAFPSGYVLDETGELTVKYFSKEALIAIAESGRTEQVQCRMRSEGQYRYEIVTIRGIPKNRKHRLNVYVSRRVIDDEKRKEFALKQQCDAANAYAAFMVREKSTFIASVARKIRTHLCTVIAGTKLLEKADNTYAASCSTAADDILKIASDCAYSAEIDSRALVPEISVFSIKALVDEVSSLIKPQLDAKNLLYRVAYDNLKTDSLRGDRTKLKQILFNLLQNALKYSRSGGNITFTIVRNQQLMCFYIADNGLGVDTNAGNIFAPFAASVPNFTEGDEYTGLELYVAKNLTEYLGGTLTYTSRAGFGATFMAEIPFENAGILITADTTDMKVLLADNDKASLDSAAEILTGLNVTVEKASDGFEAINMINASIDGGAPYNLCILEHKLPEMNAIEIVRRFNRYINANIPIAVMSPESCAVIRSQYTMYSVKFIRKPLTSDSLRLLIEEVARERSIAATQKITSDIVSPPAEIQEIPESEPQDAAPSSDAVTQ